MSLGNRSPLAIDALTKLSVPINGVCIPFRQIIQVLQRFCKPLLFRIDDPVFDIAFSGSTFLTRVGGENILICTRHQFKSPSGPPFDAQDVVTPVSVSGVMFGAHPISARFPTKNEDRDRTWDDIIAIRFEAGTEDPHIDELFLDMDWPWLRTLKEVNLQRIVSIFAIGFPTSSTDYDPIYDAELNPIGVSVKSRWVSIFLKVVSREKFDFETRIQMIQHPRYELELLDSDGLSGAPVFFVYFDNFRFMRLGFAGMITNVRGHVYQIYDASNVKNFLFGRRV